MRKRTQDDYGPKTNRVGKGRPPVATRWKRGQSGNPKGRPKGSKNLDTIVTELLSRKIRYSENGKIKKSTIREAIFKRIAEGALKGDLKHATFLLQRDAEIARKAPPAQKQSVSDLDPLSPLEQQKRSQEAYLWLIKGQKL